ncbi:MAG: potassium channel family protein [Bacillota bacterium]
MRPIHRVALLLGFLSVVVTLGTIGFMVLLDVDLIDGLYMTVITISTVGYTEVAPMTKGAQLFSIGLIIISVGMVGYVVSQLGSFFKEGYLSESWRKAKMEKTIDQLKNHYILCGSGETGTYIIQQFLKRQVPFVVIDQDPEVIEWLKERDLLYIQGNATNEDILDHARIEKAKGLVATLADDADNVFVSLTARQMNPKLHIVAKAVEENAHAKLKRAGANFTVSPNEIGGRKMVAMLLKPSTTYFMDSIIHTEDVTLDLEEITIHKESELCEKTIKQAAISKRTGLIILAIKQADDERFKFNPTGNTQLNPGDKIIVIGAEDQIDILRELALDIKGD